MSAPRPSRIYGDMPPWDLNAFSRRLDASLEKVPEAGCRVYFRADDAGVPGRNWDRLVRLFLAREMPLNIAVVPAWLSPGHRQALAPAADRSGSLFCWHQHGWRHANHESRGKKQEFGPGRPAHDLVSDLESGIRKMEKHLGEHFFRAFTPPWNRCDSRTLDHLKNLGFAAVSRDAGASPQAGLPEIPVHVDLHTRKDAEILQGRVQLSRELEQALGTGTCGIMIHHRRMNPAAFECLDRLLARFRQARNLTPLTFRELVAHGN